MPRAASRWSSDEREIEEAIRLILGTAYGERPMRPEFGCAIHDFVFADADAATAGRIAYEVRALAARWEPRIEVDDVDVSSIDRRRTAACSHRHPLPHQGPPTTRATSSSRSTSIPPER